MGVALGSDHGGYHLKQEIIRYLEKRGIPYKDFGCGDASSCDYPEFGIAAAKAVASGEYEKGIVVCTTGIGISIAANKVKGIRCALCSDTVSAKLTREHNDANMLALERALWELTWRWASWRHFGYPFPGRGETLQKDCKDRTAGKGKYAINGNK